MPTGKTSLIRLLVGERKADAGRIEVHESVKIGYNSQSRDALNPDRPLWKEVVGEDESVKITNDYSMHSRAYVAQFNFSGQDQMKLIRSLSGGERNRVQLAKSLKQGCNLLLLDEPTNDLDVDTLRALEESLAEFDGMKEKE